MGKNYEQQFLAFYDKHADAIFRYCLYRVFDRETAKDITQETFCKTWEYLTKNNKTDNVRALTYKIAHNLIIDRSRTNHPTESIEAMNEVGVEVSDKKNLAEQTHTNLETEKVLQIIKTLDPIYQEVVVLRYINELKPKEIAEILQESENTISVRINRGLKQLRKKIKL